MHAATDSDLATVYLFSGNTHESTRKIPEGSNVCVTMRFSVIINVYDMHGICVFSCIFHLTFSWFINT